MMQKVMLTILLISCVWSSYAQNSSEQKTTDTSNNEVKTGWNTGVLPALGYDSNLGLLYGGIVNMYHYGDGSNYPNYNHNLYLQLSAYTKGSYDAILYFDSFTLLPEKQVTARLSFNKNGAYPFYGFNGKQTHYDANREDIDHEDFVSQVFYRYDRELIKSDIIVQDNIGDSDFRWLAGLDLGYYKIDTVDIDNLNKDRDNDDKIPTSTDGLYENYVKYGIINKEESDGGFDNSVKLGLVYDTRDRLTNPMKGMWTEVLMRVAPEFLGNYNTSSHLSIIHRQYFTLVEEKLSFAYRLWYEATFGDAPTYSRQYLTASNYYEGFGGSTTLRGALLGRVVGQQTGLANLALRWKAKRFNCIGQNFYVGVNAFLDNAMIFKGYDMDVSHIPDATKEILFNENYKELITTGGLGLKLVMNENFVISAEYAKAFDKQYGDSGTYIQIGYIF